MESKVGSWIDTNEENILGKKSIDKSIFKDGTTIPNGLVEKFMSITQAKEFEKGQSENISIIIKNDTFKAVIRRVNQVKRDNVYQINFRKEMKDYLSKVLPKSHKYIFTYNENPDIPKPQEYIEFYKTDKPNIIRVKLIQDENYVFQDELEYQKSVEENASGVGRVIDIKRDFFKYIGTKEENLVPKYQKSYKLVLLISLLKVANEGGKAIFDDVCTDIMSMYINRYKKGVKAETEDSDIQKQIKTLSLEVVKKVMRGTPYEKINGKNFMYITKEKDKEFLSFNSELWNTLDEKDKNMMLDILQYKLKKYYDEKQLGEIMKLEDNFKPKDVLEYIKENITSKSYYYDGELIEDMYLSLKSKPFVILYGISGTGKSNFVECFANSIGANKENEGYTLVPVKPDWSDSSELIGYRNIEGEFQPGILTNIIKEASENKERPYFVCLDEMNLARVEYYFSDMLSIIESRKLIDGEIKTDKIIRKELLGSNAETLKTYGDLYIPENLYIVGTVNMDETTFPFSKKVLDRANTIEFDNIKLDFNFEDYNVKIKDRCYSNKFLKANFLKLVQCVDYKKEVKDVIDKLKKINEILKKSNMQIAYRIRDEICFYVVNAVKDDIMGEEKAFDYAVKQKILPRIQGSSNEVENTLVELFKYFTDENDDILKGDYVDEESIKAAENYIKSEVKYKKTLEKLLQMIRRFHNDGFTTFWN
ncbi:MULTISPECIES: McrB family protein [Clostridium]|uniref:McrB family protein n=1 Tax=Clostridium TaxID=1485 RepID=UPI0008240747|nr:MULTISPECIES: AAA family ATPase [Clostridium]PJI09233.1 hypothetical protein CUB90_15715 [Clostridium sp. CT7]